MLKQIIIFSSLIFSSFSYAQVYQPVVEDVKIHSFTAQDLQNNGCPMPPMNIKINPLIDPIQWDYSRRSRDLKPMSAHANSNHSVTGLHSAGLNLLVQSQVFYLKDNNNNSTCYTMWPSVITLRLSSKIYISQETALLSCSKSVTENHELQHQKVALYALQEAQNLLNNRLNSLYSKPIFFPTYEDALKHYNSNIEHLKSQFLHQFNLIADPLNAQLDSPSNYIAEDQKCPYERDTLEAYLRQP